jgi:hypothetical protein
MFDGLALLFWGAYGVSAAKAGIENAKCKQDVRTLPNGVRYYYDRRGITRLCSNDNPIYTNGNGLWTDTDYKVVYDGRDDRRKKINREYYEHAKKIAEERGKRLKYIEQMLPGDKEWSKSWIDIENNWKINIVFKREELIKTPTRVGYNYETKIIYTLGYTDLNTGKDCFKKISEKEYRELPWQITEKTCYG